MYPVIYDFGDISIFGFSFHPVINSYGFMLMVAFYSCYYFLNKDLKRLGYNPDNNILFPNHTGADHTGDNIDLLSNGFKIRWDDGVNNTSGENFIYMAWAEAPFVNSNGVPCNAR